MAFKALRTRLTVQAASRFTFRRSESGSAFEAGRIVLILYYTMADKCVGEDSLQNELAADGEDQVFKGACRNHCFGSAETFFLQAGPGCFKSSPDKRKNVVP